MHGSPRRHGYLPQQRYFVEIEARLTGCMQYVDISRLLQAVLEKVGGAFGHQHRCIVLAAGRQAHGRARKQKDKAGSHSSGKGFNWQTTYWHKACAEKVVLI
jgi:hypothetical protein